MKLLPLRKEWIGRYTSTEKRDLVLSILKSTTTKREAKEYLTRYRTEQSSRSLLHSPGRFHHKETDNSLVNLFLANKSPLQKSNLPLRSYARKAAVFRVPSSLHTSVLKRMIHAFKTLQKLGVSPLIILDDAGNNIVDHKLRMSCLASKALEVASAMSNAGSSNSLHLVPLSFPFNKSANELTLFDANLVNLPICQGNIPILVPIAYDVTSGKNCVIPAQDAILALITSLKAANGVDIQKVVFIDPVGGIPSIERDKTSHVFVNLSQEYSDIISELHIGFLDPSVRDKHLANLFNMRQILLANERQAKQNDTTGIILRPEDLTQHTDMLNPIAYNILTDRPLISSSLPSGRSRTPQVYTSIIKKGFDVKISFTHHLGWKEKFDGLVREGYIDKDRFTDMINDSFGKRLNSEDYFERINSNLDCIIIIGDYDGGAVITNEILSDGRTVPYLDKFAITRKNQGLPSMADVIFKLMLQAYQDEVIWRSRSLNPVNKWYFERCNGSFNGSNSGWKVFYAGESFNRRISRDIKRRLAQYWELIQRIPKSFI